MSMPTDRRSLKRLATRQVISNIATRLFIERGFDNVTVDDVAEAAGVGRMTVFNHFPRKEDLFFDRDDEKRELLRLALREKDPHISSIETLRLLSHRLVTERSQAVEFSHRSQSFIKTIEASETLKARARAIRDEVTHVAAAALAESVGRTVTDPDAQLAAGLLLAIWTTAVVQAHRTFRQTQSSAKATRHFLAIIDQGVIGLKAAMAGTPYV